MKYISKYLPVLIIFVLAVSNFAIARAYDYFYYDGSSDSSTTNQQIQTYRRQSSDMQQKINTLPSVSNPNVYIPVLFGVGIKDISPNFGDPRSGGRTHQGEDILAPKGDPIVSPTPAVVLRAGNSGGTEGIYVYTANPGGETFIYYHLDRVGEGVTPGAVLEQGSLIGYVDTTGNAAGGPPHLHLEIHNSAGVPTDPFPRLTNEFSIQQKIAYLSAILAKNQDPVALSRFLVTNFRGEFNAALSANIVLPQQITDALASIPASSAPISSSNLPAGDLTVGSSGTFVVALQKYLIQAAAGPAASRLAYAGATGYFGTITKAALVEFQIAFNILPASGYYGASTRTFIAAHPIGTTSTVAPNPTPVPTSSTSTFPRNLSLGSVGEDVRTLQRILNALGFIIAATGNGSPGQETTYFGPATQTAVIRFQVARNISPAVGYVGLITQAALLSSQQ